MHKHECGRLHLSLDGRGKAYVATYGVADSLGPSASIALPREIVEAAVFINAKLGLELRTDGTLMALASHTSMQTLACASLTQLVNEALRPDLLALEDEPNCLAALEAELERALLSVRASRLRIGSR
jgi:hypothetical protein